jgi:serine/threonine-protein kinase
LKGEIIVREIPGRLLGNRYKLLENIGEGGMARVYRGMDTKLNRPVAIKILYEQFANDPDFLRRFKQEAKAAAKLSHPAIVNIYDEGEEGDVHYIIMEYVDGYTLKDVILRDSRLKPEEAAQIAIQICDALAHAHSQNVIHRDIKPQNIILTCEGRVKVTDFGIARATADTTITYGRSLLGSVYYSSPEQARGNHTDQKSDIYSLGILLYEMLTGVVPFSGESPISIALKHLQEDIVPPGKLVPELPSALETVVLKAVRKERQLRYSSALELRDDLEDWLVKTGEKINYISNPHFKRSYSSELSRGQANDMDKEQEDEMKRRGRSFKRIFGYGAVLVAVFLIMLFGYKFLHSFLVVPEVAVPELTNLSLEEAEKELLSLGLGCNILREVYSDTVPVNHIVSQETPAQRSVRKGKIIDLVISLGPEYVVVPFLISRTELEARLILSDLGLNMTSSQEYSEDIAPGYVIRQDPGKDFRLTRGDVVHVIISEGKKPFSIRSFQGWLLDNAKEWLNIYGLVLRNLEEEYSGEFPAGQIISQFPAAGELVQAGDPVDLVVSKGREPGTYKSYTIDLYPQVARGQLIKIYVEDEEGRRVIFEGAYQGQVISARGIGSGQFVLMEFRNQEYHIIDIKRFP